MHTTRIGRNAERRLFDASQIDVPIGPLIFNFGMTQVPRWLRTWKSALQWREPRTAGFIFNFHETLTVYDAVCFAGSVQTLKGAFWGKFSKRKQDSALSAV